ncbi:MAG: gamma-glutamyltransferase [Verrucomicrobiota bacterium]|nr:gamma-glutamyltransferase [Verrucomicrobiota bacterium]
MLAWTAKAVVAGALAPRVLLAAGKTSDAQPHGAIGGEPAAERTGARVLAEGGNAVDAIVAAALTAAVSAPQMTGIGGYGGHMIIALADGSKVSSIDFNCRAPAAAHEGMFPLDEKGNVRHRANSFGWLAAGVPGVLAGMQLALERYGTRSFRDSVGPALELARTGFKLGPGLAATMRGCATQFRADEGSRKLFFKEGKPLAAGETFRNPDLAALLATLAERNSVDSFYRGDIAQRIAGDFKKHGGLVTAEDLAAYHAHEVESLALEWRGFDIRTAPLTAGGLTVLQALAILRALEWDNTPAGFARTHALVEALRFAWHDRLRLLGDPGGAKEPVTKLLSPDYAGEAAAQIGQVVKENSFLPLHTESRVQTGTINLSAVDRHGNMAVCTFTHGGSFGARVTVDGLGLTLGHGMSRFEPRPGHPNSPGPGKRPLHNMCPAIVLRQGRPIFGLGGRGGRRIPNAVFAALTQFVALDRNMAEAIAAPRLHTEGRANVQLEKAWPDADLKALVRLGYVVRTGPAATLSAVSFDPQTGECRVATR